MNKYKIRDFRKWDGLNCDLAITDPPFGINFDKEKKNYNRKSSNVVDGYVEWSKEEYNKNIEDLLDVLYRNLDDNGQALIFSGWNHSYIIQERIKNYSNFKLEGKRYWLYNFVSHCSVRPSQDLYEIFWVVKSDDWTYNEYCSTKHCQGDRQRNLASMFFKKNYTKDMPKYKTRLQYKPIQCIIEHHSRIGDTIFDPLAGSGMIGIVAEDLERKCIMGEKNKRGKDVYKEMRSFYNKKE